MSLKNQSNIGILHLMFFQIAFAIILLKVVRQQRELHLQKLFRHTAACSSSILTSSRSARPAPYLSLRLPIDDLYLYEISGITPILPYINMPNIAYTANRARYINNTTGINNLFPIPVIYADSTATSDYNAATISSIVFGIFMALLTLYMIWQTGVRCNSAYPQFLISGLQSQYCTLYSSLIRGVYRLARAIDTTTPA
jgi:hypothetical protein